MNYTSHDWSRSILSVCAGCLFLAGLVPVALAEDDAPEPAVRPAAVVAPVYSSEKWLAFGDKKAGNTLQTFALGPDGNLYGLMQVITRKPRAGLGAFLARAVGNDADDVSAPTYEILVADPEGKLLRRWPLAVSADRVTVAADGSVWVGGGGRMIVYSSDGKELANAALPHVELVLANKEEAKAATEEHHQEAIESNKQMLAMYEKAIAQKEQQAREAKKPGAAKPAKPAKPADEESAELSEPDYFGQLPLASLKQMAEHTRNLTRQLESTTPQERLELAMTQFRSQTSVHAISVSADHAYYVARSLRGYSYAVWRINRDLKDPVKVVDGLGGCCGQCEIRLNGDKLYLADNCKHRVAVYDLKGQLVSQFGKRDRAGDGGAFGSCCNPMNLCFSPSGQIITAESEGLIKGFAPDGTYQRLLGRVDLKSGCTHVPVAMTPDSKILYLLDRSNSRIARLEQKNIASAAK
ncbi:MAG: hypothetical protein ACHRHE_18630 [Tepidisphaerales bacterium]